jgi:hypothetical protein
MVRLVAIAIALVACSKNDRTADPQRHDNTDPQPQVPQPKPQPQPKPEPKPQPDPPKAPPKLTAKSKCQPLAGAKPDPSYQGCKSNAECGSGERCAVARRVGNSVFANACVRDACFDDDDCGKIGTCECAPYGNSCSSNGNCRTSADCAGGLACEVDRGCRGFTGGYFSRTAADTCPADGLCKQGACRYSAEVGHWACIDMHCPVG